MTSTDLLTGLVEQRNATGIKVQGDEWRAHFRRLRRFWTKVAVGNGCWTWLGYRSPDGYGTFKWASYDSEWAHRASWRLHYGPIPENIRVLHHCDNPPCVRPDHLFLGTDADNLRDMALKGRHYSRTRPDRILRGAQHPRTKLSAPDVATIRQRRAEGASKSLLARQFGVSNTLIRKVSQHHWSDDQ